MTPLAAYLLLFLAVGAGFILVHLLAGKLIRPNTPDAEKGTIYECGEPTIGSAWIQFDLRFYVVALLFVIFDVEVAFFFPWAEVFGNANAVANAPPGPTPGRPWTATQYNDYARRVIDLAPPPAVASTDHKVRNNWALYQALAQVAPADLEAKDKLSPAEKASLRKVTPVELLALQALTEEDRSAIMKLTAEQMKEIDTPAKRTALFNLPADVKEALRKTVPEDLATLFRVPPTVRALVDDLPVERNRDSASQMGWLAFAEVIVFFGVLLVGFAYLWRRGDLAWVRSVGSRPSAGALPGTNGANTAVTSRPMAGAGAGERS